MLKRAAAFAAIWLAVSPLKGVADAAPWLMVRAALGSEPGSGLALPHPAVAAMATCR